MRLIPMLAIASLAFGCTSTSGPSTDAAYAPTKAQVCSSCQRATVGVLPPEMYPQRGAVLGFGSFLSTKATFFIVDFDGLTISGIETDVYTESGARKWRILSKNRIRIANDDHPRFVEAANLVWNPPPPRMMTGLRRMPSHTTANLILFDGDMIFKLDFIFPWNDEAVTFSELVQNAWWDRRAERESFQ